MDLYQIDNFRILINDNMDQDLKNFFFDISEGMNGEKYEFRV